MPNRVPAEGSPESKIAFVGEAPSYNEVLQGRPFVGKAGQQFNNYLTHAKIPRHECYITNLFKVPVTKRGDVIYANEEELYNPKKGFTPKGYEYVSELKVELKNIKANVVVALGDPATFALVGRHGITKIRGSRYYNEEIGKKVIPCIHPAAALRQYVFRYFIIHDFKVAKDEMLLSGPLTLINRVTYTKEDYAFYKGVLENILDGDYGSKIGFDIEVMNRELSCLVLAPNDTLAYVIPFHYKGQPYFTVEEEAHLIQLVGKILEDETITIVGQNLAFDISFMYGRYGIVTHNYDDTMVAHRMMFPDYPAGLDFITSMYTDLPYYKDEGKQYFKWGGNDDEFLEYNAKDGLVCMEAMPQFLYGLERTKNLEAYKEQTRLILPITYMGQRGIKVDVEGLQKAKDQAEAEIQEAQEELNSLAGAELNPNSPKQVATYFYVHKKIPAYKKDGKMTTNDGAMTRIARKGYKEAQLILKIRHLRKMIGTYFEVKLKDDRLVCSYSPITGMGRLSSSQDIFGYGSNMQNQPKSMNKYFLADEGCLIYNVDLSQADNRSVAYIAPEPRMIKAFEDKEDVHALTASLIFGMPMEEIKALDKLHDADPDNPDYTAPIGYGDQSHRYWGKKSNHSLNFGMYYRKFSYVLEIPEVEGKQIWEAYHRAYPGIQKSYHRWVRDTLSRGDKDIPLRTLQNAFGRRYLFLDRWDEYLFNQAYAFIPQSNTADIINRWGINPLYYEDRFKDVELLRQVHDSINFQIPISIGIEKHISILKEIKQSLEQKLKWKAYEFTIPAEFTVGLNLGEQKKFDPNTNAEEILSEYFISYR